MATYTPPAPTQVNFNHVAGYNIPGPTQVNMNHADDGGQGQNQFSQNAVKTNFMIILVT